MQLNYPSRKIFYIIIALIILVNSASLTISQDAEEETELKLKTTTVKTNGEIDSSNNQNKITLNENSQLTINYNGVDYEYSNLQTSSTDGITEQPQITLNQDGQMIQATFKTGKAGTYLIGNQELELKEGTQILFENKKLTIIPPKDTEIPIPKEIDDSNLVEEFSAKIPKDSQATLNRYSISGYKKELELKYDKEYGAYYFDDKDFTKIDGMLVYNKEGQQKTYLVDSKSKVDQIKEGTAVFIEQGSLYAKNKGDKPGTSFYLNKENIIGPKIENNDIFAFQLGEGTKQASSIEITHREGLTPLVKVTQNALIQQDSTLIPIENGNIIEPRNDKRLFTATKENTNSPIEVHTFNYDKNGKLKAITEVNKGSIHGQGNALLVSNHGFMAFTKNDINNPNPITIESGSTTRELTAGTIPSDIPQFIGNGLHINYPTKQNLEARFGIEIIDNNRYLKSNPYNAIKIQNILLAAGEDQVNKLTSIELSLPKGYLAMTIYVRKKVKQESGVIASTLKQKIEFYPQREGSLNVGIGLHEFAHVADNANPQIEAQWENIGGQLTYVRGYDRGNIKGESRAVFVGETRYATEEWWQGYYNKQTDLGKKITLSKISHTGTTGEWSQQDRTRIFSYLNQDNSPKAQTTYMQTGREIVQSGQMPTIKKSSRSNNKRGGWFRRRR
jgi:hypothetical protein